MTLSFTKTFKTLSLIEFGCGKLQNGAVTQKQHRLQNEAPNIKKEMIAEGTCIVPIDLENERCNDGYLQKGIENMEPSCGSGDMPAPDWNDCTEH